MFGIGLPQKVVFYITLLIDLFIPIIIFTPYSLRGKILDLIIIVLGIIMTGWLIYRKRKAKQSQINIYQNLIHWTLRGLLFIFILPIVIYFGIVVFRDISYYFLLQKISSPHQTQDLYVYFSPLEETNQDIIGILTFTLESRAFPLIEKQVYQSARRFDYNEKLGFGEWIEEGKIRILSEEGIEVQL